MRKALEDHRRALETDQIAYHADIAFHKAIAAASKNPFAVMVLEAISEPLLEQRKLTNLVPNAAEDGLRDHFRIYRAVKEGDAKKSRAAMSAHMVTAEHYWRLAKAQTAEGKRAAQGSA
jgi:GntR family transcriptional repressor for pyruvate dehydrogenase complex